MARARPSRSQQIGSPIRREHTPARDAGRAGLNKIGRVVELEDTPVRSRGMIAKVAASRARRRTDASADARSRRDEAQRNRRQRRARARTACASAAASARARARPAAAAARARRRARACASRASKAARCRCIGACRSAASTTSSRMKLNEVNLGRVQAAIDAGKLDAKATVDVEPRWSRPACCAAPSDGVRLLGGGELKAKVNFAVYGASKSAIAAVEKAGGTVKILAPQEPRRAARMPREAKPKARDRRPRRALSRCTAAIREPTVAERGLDRHDRPIWTTPIAGGRAARSREPDAWSLQRNNWRPISTSRRSPRPTS